MLILQLNFLKGPSTYDIRFLGVIFDLPTYPAIGYHMWMAPKPVSSTKPFFEHGYLSLRAPS